MDLPYWDEASSASAGHGGKWEKEYRKFPYLSSVQGLTQYGDDQQSHGATDKGGE